MQTESQAAMDAGKILWGRQTPLLYVQTVRFTPLSTRRNFPRRSTGKLGDQSQFDTRSGTLLDYLLQRRLITTAKFGDGLVVRLQTAHQPEKR